MKKETLEKRINKHLFTKSGHLATKYIPVIDLLNHPNWTIRPIIWVNKGRKLIDKHEAIEKGLSLLGVDYVTGNDAPRGGKDGYFIRLTKKGAKQVKDFTDNTDKKYY